MSTKLHLPIPQATLLPNLDQTNYPLLFPAGLEGGGGDISLSNFSKSPVKLMPSSFFWNNEQSFTSEEKSFQSPLPQLQTINNKPPGVTAEVGENLVKGGILNSGQVNRQKFQEFVHNLYDQKAIKEIRTPGLNKTAKLDQSRNLNREATKNLSSLNHTQLSTKRGTARLTDVLKIPLPRYQTKQDAFLKIKLEEING